MAQISNNWNKVKITSPEELIKLWKADNPIDFAIDTETDGLFQMTTKPFLIIFGWTPKDYITKKSTVVAFEPTKEMLQTMYDLVKDIEAGYMHNAKFDMHVLENFYIRYPHKHIYDTMSIARLILEAIPVNHGGPSLALKDLASKYIEKTGKNDQKLIKKYKALIQKERATKLNNVLLQKGFAKKEWNKVILEKLESDPILSVEEIAPPEVTKIWNAWKKAYPRTKGLKKVDRVTYEDIYNYSAASKKAMIKYAFNDVIYTLEIARKFMPYIDKLGSRADLEKERKAMYAFYESEKVGFKLDMDYLNQSKEAMKTEIINIRVALQKLLGKDIDAVTFSSSPKQIKDWLLSKGLEVTSTAAEALKLIAATTENKEIKQVLSHVLHHRSFIKKYSTDLLGYFLNEYNGRRYTSYNMNATVTGRISNDVQQMANAGILNEKGEELFHPRKAIIPTGGDYPKILYIDYSQVEVRLQAHYTWLATNGKGDVNLLRIYVPFKCQNEDEVMWDPNNPEHTKQEFIDKHTWTQLEDKAPWTITDMHMITAREAFPELKGLPNDDPLVQLKRKKAKPVVFGIMYGAGLNKIKSMVDDPDEGERLYKANKAAFPGIVAYADMLRKEYNKQGYVQNAYGRKYRTKKYTHKFSNYVIQGTGADLLKQKLVLCNDYLADKKSRIMHNIHDELQFEIHKDEDYVIKELQKIMSDTGNRFIVPILADLEIADTNWKEKYEIS